MKRREFLILAGAAVVTGCRSADETLNSAESRPARVINAGPVGHYLADGVYAGFRDQGFFVVRQGEKLFALSAICTHRKCKLKAESNRSFYCPCHGSTFDPGGHVTQGPARRDLPLFAISVDPNGQVLVTVPAV
jgi:Rieske Fe-S protein